MAETSELKPQQISCLCALPDCPPENYVYNCSNYTTYVCCCPRCKSENMKKLSVL